MSLRNTYTIGAAIFQAPIIEPALYVVPTPIGNLKDISVRAIETLAAVDYVVCEDTRVSRILLKHYGLLKKLFCYHEHNAKFMAPKLIALLEQGSSLALISDAGTPLISDPGFKLVEEVQRRSLKLYGLPGPCAFITALSVSALPTDNFAFMGFLPSKQKQRLATLICAKEKAMTTIFYETPQRLLASLVDAINVFGENHKASIARELTKRFETVNSTTLKDLYSIYQAKESIKGEIVLLFSPYIDKAAYSATRIDELLEDYASQETPTKAAAKVAQMTGLKKQILYQRLLQLKDKR